MQIDISFIFSINPCPFYHQNVIFSLGSPTCTLKSENDCSHHVKLPAENMQDSIPSLLLAVMIFLIHIKTKDLLFQ